MPEYVEIQLPPTITALFYIGVIVLIAILLLLLRINGRLSTLSYKMSKSSRSSKLAVMGYKLVLSASLALFPAGFPLSRDQS